MCSHSLIQISPMTLDDIPSLVEIERRSHLEPWSADSFAEELNRTVSYSLVASMSDRPMRTVGYICFWVVTDEIQVLNLTVEQAVRRCGIGHVLMLGALRLGTKQLAKVATLEVRRSNLAAQSVYEAIGFRVVGHRPGYYGVVEEPALIMRLELDERWKAQWMPNAEIY